MKINFTKEQLSDLYYNQRKSMRQISKILGMSQTTIWKEMSFFGLKRRKKSDAMKMITKTLEHRQKLADVRFNKKIGVGSSNCQWNGGSGKNKNDRNQVGLRYWSNSVKRRDKFICQMCGVSGLIECKHCGSKPVLHSHHIKSWNTHPELRFDINNGVTLCSKCHHGLKRITGLIAGKSRTDNQQPNHHIANRMMEGSTVSPAETIMDTNALLERDDMTCAV